ncbi:MAG: nucleotide exchange factor GrpE [bacterium]|nr:nucleotide exchange factor GrpE [Mycoplasmatota bacterium]MDD6756700.1 nucleotide exchange factor GrpE [bacterium]
MDNEEKLEEKNTQVEVLEEQTPIPEGISEDKKQKKEKKNKKDSKLKEENEKLLEQIQQLQVDNQSLIDKVKLTQAELVNYRKRKDEETANMLKFANQDLLTELINVVDNFERAIKLDDNDLTDELSKFLDGFKMIYANLMEILKKFGVEEINRVGEVFDPSQEQALMTDCVDEMDDDVVIEVLLKGYKLNGRVIRPASVKVNSK